MTIISGALKSISLLNLLFLFITLRYKSLRSEVANLPPSRGTSGLNSGGSTGKTLRIIHSGLIPEVWKASKTLSLFAIFFTFASEVVFSSSSLSFSISSVNLIDLRSSSIPSAPIIALNSSPCCSENFK